MDVRETITAVGTLRVPRVFDVVDAIYVPDGTTGIFALYLGGRLLDVREPEAIAEGGLYQLCFLGVYRMPLLMYNTCSGVCVACHDAQRPVTYTIVGRKYAQLSDLAREEEFEGTLEEFLRRDLRFPVVTCGALNYLRYNAGVCGTIFGVESRGATHSPDLFRMYC